MAVRRVELRARIRSVPPQTVFDGVVRFERYPELAPHVRSATVHKTVPYPVGRSSWELHFRSGLLRWTERERFFREAARIEFEQINGDFERFTGSWALHGEGGDTVAHFLADFDFGIPSIEGILDPIAERVIKESVAWVLVGLFGDVELGERFDLAPVPRL